MSQIDTKMNQNNVEEKDVELYVAKQILKYYGTIFILIIAFSLFLWFLPSELYSYTTPYIDRTSEVYQFTLRVATDVYKTPISKGVYNTPLMAATKAVRMCTIQSSHSNCGVTDIDIEEMSIMIEEDLKKIKR